MTESSPPTPYTDNALRISRLVRTQYNSWGAGTGEAVWYTWHAWDPTALDYPTGNANMIKNHITYCNKNNLTIAAIGFGWCWDMTWQNSPTGTADPDFNVRWGGSSEGGPDGSKAWGLNSADTSLVHNRVTMDDYIQATLEYIKLIQDSGFSTKVLFTTGPVDGNANNENGYQREIKHTYIRDFVKADPSRILFDYADILCWSNDGDQNLCTWNGHEYPQIHADNMKDLDGNYAEDGDHIGQRGAVRLAKAMWWLLARIAGWDGSTDIKTYENNNINVFPNPSKGVFTIQLNKGLLAGSDVEIFNQVGQRIYFGRYTNEPLDLKNNKPGLYFIRITLEDKIITKKLVLVP